MAPICGPPRGPLPDSAWPEDRDLLRRCRRGGGARRGTVMALYEWLKAEGLGLAANAIVVLLARKMVIWIATMTRGVLLSLSEEYRKALSFEHIATNQAEVIDWHIPGKWWYRLLCFLFPGEWVNVRHSRIESFGDSLAKMRNRRVDREDDLRKLIEKEQEMRRGRHGRTPPTQTTNRSGENQRT